jgi:hypothetical protein
LRLPAFAFVIFGADLALTRCDLLLLLTEEKDEAALEFSSEDSEIKHDPAPDTQPSLERRIVDGIAQRSPSEYETMLDIHLLAPFDSKAFPIFQYFVI